MESDDESHQITGVVIISLPPPDNPSLGKTITAFALTGNDYYPPQPHQTGQQTQTHQENHLPIQSPPPPQTHPYQFSSSRFFFGNPRKLLSFLCISLLAVISYRSLLSSTLLQELRNSNDDDDRGVKSFIFPVYHKFSTGEISKRDLEHRLQRLVYKENLAEASDAVIGPRQINKLSSSSAASVESSSIFPVRGNVYPDGLYFTYVLVGNPPRPYYVDIDTGSDLTWIQCDAPCASCAKGANALYKPRRGNLVPSKDLLCMEVQRSLKSGYCETETCQQCDYEIDYADHSSSMGVLARDELHLTTSNGSLTKSDFIFGCAYDQQGLLLNTLAKTDGILGLSKARVSLPSQLATRGIINNVVGHCLTTDVSGGGYMFLGDEYLPRWGMAWVPMFDSSSMEFYSTGVTKLNYGKLPLSLGGPDSSARRVVFDSGSSYTYLTKESYSELVASLEEVSRMELIQDTSDQTLPLCWRAPFPIRSVADVKHIFKTITFQFGSKWLIISKKFQIPPEGYLIISNKGNVCLGILDGSKVHGGSTIILGDISLRGQLVVYDNVNKRIGWAPSDCAKPARVKSLPLSDGLPYFEG
ncbi:hypothetical protein Tsubulata_032097 [Turnera subulata]|uniref:Peptidase A1 domain-containing protein n=1 Tax=Turnera subulata TaxID=218843 RepID=A0A9Q0FFI0_9ROSI|nr:hypothetical protein Tsubulata_032097 [Turnera subulata]